MDFVERVMEFNHEAGRPSVGFNVRHVALHTGFQLEELAEKIGAIGEAYPLSDERRHDLLNLAATMSIAGESFKRGEYDRGVSDANRKDLLDGDVDIMVVTVGAMMTSGANVQGALNHVCERNEAKRVGGSYTFDENRKIKKPPGWTPPDLTPFVDET